MSIVMKKIAVEEVQVNSSLISLEKPPPILIAPVDKLHLPHGSPTSTNGGQVQALAALRTPSAHGPEK